MYFTSSYYSIGSFISGGFENIAGEVQTTFPNTIVIIMNDVIHAILPHMTVYNISNTGFANPFHIYDLSDDV